jgi:hypothetical protein
MTRTGLPVVLATVLMTMVAVGSAEAGPFSFRASGSFLGGGTTIDTNNDGTTADLFIVSGQSSQLGSVTNQTVVEWVFDPSACPRGAAFPRRAVATGSAVVTRAGNGDLLFGVITSGTNCFNGATAEITAAGNITGGTGRFEGATGTFTVEATATPLVADSRLHTFGSVVATAEGTINK